MIVIGGEPATGKTTLMEAFIKDRVAATFQWGILRGLKLTDGVRVLGIYDGKPFGGTDRLSMAVQSDAISYATLNGGIVIAEGDRLCNASFITATNASLIILECSANHKKLRHAARGDSQTTAFLKSRRTKVENLKKTFPDAKIFRNETPDDMELILDYLKNVKKDFPFA